MFFSCIGCALPLAHAGLYNAEIVDDSGTVSNVYYYEAGSAFIDDVTGTPNVKARVYATSASDLSGKYVTFVYRVGGSYKLVSITYSSNFSAFSSPVSCGVSCYYADSNLSLNFNSLYAVYPALVYAVVSDDASLSPPGVDSYVYVNNSNGWLPGAYSYSDPASSSLFNQVTGNTTIYVSGITGIKYDASSSSLTKNSTALAIGICNQSNGTECYSDILASRRAVSLYTGATNSIVSAEGPQHRYVVVNGIPSSSLCFGPNLLASISVNDSSPEDGELVNISTTVTNNGNTNTSQSFYIAWYKDEVSGVSCNVAGPSEPCKINESFVNVVMAPGSSVSRSTVWNTTFQTGDHTVIAFADAYSSQSECNESDNRANTSVSVQLAYHFRFYIDGEESTTFPYSGRPYNVSVYVYDSLLRNVSTTVKVTEENGLSPFAILQIVNDSVPSSGLKSYSTAEVKSGSDGWAHFTLFPMGNKLIADYGEIITYYTGNYSMYAGVYVNGTLKRSLELNNSNLTMSDPSEVISVTNQAAVEAVFQYVYQAYSNMREWLGYPW